VRCAETVTLFSQWWWVAGAANPEREQSATVHAGRWAAGATSPHGRRSATGEAVTGPATATLRVMTFNLRYAHERPPNLWRARRPVARELIATHAPDLIGTQEGEYHQLVDMQHDLPEYRWIGLGREGGSRGEFMAVYYRRDRFVPLAFDHFWLADTPDRIGARTWGNRDPRMVTWVRFRDERGGGEFHLLNTHLDHEVQESRERSAALILERIGALDAGLPLIATGDFNAPAGCNAVYRMLVEDGPFTDVWRALGKAEPPLGTYHAFDGVETDGARGRIDWILTRGAVEPLAAEVITYSRGGQYPSDHFPVLARLALQ
jgi:endonuclease/exonuclease/phosphatase family metal-dependent hydrolase